MSRLFSPPELPPHTRQAISANFSPDVGRVQLGYVIPRTIEQWFQLIQYIGKMTDEIKMELAPLLLGGEETR